MLEVLFTLRLTHTFAIVSQSKFTTFSGKPTQKDTQAETTSPGHSQILSRSRGEKSGEGLGSKLRHGPEMVDSVST